MRINFIICLIIFILTASITFAQKAKPRPKTTPKQTQKTLTAKQIDDLITKLGDLIGLASEKFKEEKYQESIKEFEAIIKQIESNEKQLGADGQYFKILAMFSIGSAYEKLNETEKSIAIFENSLPIYAKLQTDDEFLAMTYQMLGRNYQKQNNFVKATKNYVKSVEENRLFVSKQKTPEKVAEAKLYLAAILVKTADAMILMSDKFNALKFCKEAEQIFTEFGKSLEVANILNRIGRILLETGNVSSSLPNFQKAVNLIENSKFEGDDISTAIQVQVVALNNLGHSYNLIGDKKTAFDYFQKSLKLCEENGLTQPKPYILNNLGFYLLEQGEYAEALQYFTQAEKLSNELNDQRTLAISLNNIGAAFVELGNYEKAWDYWDKAIKITQKMNDADTYAKLVTNTSAALLEVGELDRALELLKLVDDFFQRTGNLANRADVALILARIQRKKGEFEKSLENAQIGLKLAREIGNLKSEAGISLFIGNVYIDLNDYDNAAQNYFSAIQTAQKIGNSTVEASSLLGLSYVANFKENAPLAVLYGKKSVNQFQSLRAKIQNLDKETQKIFTESVGVAYQHLADLLIAQGRIAEAEQVLSLLKEEEFYEYVRRDDKVANELKAKISLTDEENAAFKRYNEFSENIAAIGKEYAELETEKKQLAPNQVFSKQAKLDELSRKLKDATEVFLKFLDELKVEFGEENNRVAQIDSGLQAMLKEMKANDTVIISTIASSERLNLILTTTTFQKAYTIDIKSADLNKLVADFRKVVQNPAVDPRPTGQKLYDVLLKPLAKDLADSGAKTIVWSLDGTLRYVPVSALWDGKKYLAETYSNAVITLASRDKLKDVSGDKTTWKTVGFGVSKSATIEENESGALVKRQFEALPSVPEELCKVVADATDSYCQGIINGRKFLDEKFTLQEFKNQLGNYPLVHIASHFSLKAGNDKNSYLLLGGGDERRLTIAELNRSNPMFVGVELLTLSACNTAMTGEKKANGVEIEGFGAIAQKQGAKSVLATLWAVSDPSTRDLMNEFYTFLSIQKLSKAESLRQSQVKLIYGNYNAEEISKLRSDLAGEIPPDAQQIPFQKDVKRPFAHPFYWSPFVLIGNWQ